MRCLSQRCTSYMRGLILWEDSFNMLPKSAPLLNENGPLVLKGCSIILMRDTPSYLWGALHTFEGHFFILLRSTPSYFWGALHHTYQMYFIKLMRGTSYLWGTLHNLWGALHHTNEGHSFILMSGTTSEVLGIESDTWLRKTVRLRSTVTSENFSS